MPLSSLYMWPQGTGSEYPGRLLDWDPSRGAAQDDDALPGTQALYVPRLTGQMEP